MNIGDVMRGLAIGTIAGLGTPQQQRDESFRRDQLNATESYRRDALRERLQEAALRRIATEANIARLAKEDDMQYGPVSAGELSAVEPLLKSAGISMPTGPVNRRVFDRLVQTATSLNSKESDLAWDPDTGKIVATVRPGQAAPMLPGVAPEFTASADVPEPSGKLTEGTGVPERPAVVGKASTYVSSLENLRRREADSRKAAEDKAKREKEATPKTVEADVVARRNALLNRKPDPSTWTPEERQVEADYQKILGSKGRPTSPNADIQRRILERRLKSMDEDAARKKVLDAADSVYDRLQAGEPTTAAERAKAIKEYATSARSRMDMAKKERDAIAALDEDADDYEAQKADHQNTARLYEEEAKSFLTRERELRANKTPEKPKVQPTFPQRPEQSGDAGSSAIRPGGPRPVAPGSSQLPARKPTQSAAGKVETLSRKDPRYAKLQARGLKDADIEAKFGIKLAD